ncbi:MAG: hypothetical protein DME43_04055 [Verrucomicrobia bacterium]|nr:MAG: hypothetical protein DME43_04055 [Verrucomicrobiota bacterium]PYK73018.1 MAG: hypothetical protein DME44_02655 [Verrucomicrobiota bacterium]
MVRIGQYRYSDPVLSPDGKKLLFVSDRPVNGVDRHHYEIWMCERQDDKWSERKNLGPGSQCPQPVLCFDGQQWESLFQRHDWRQRF